jgi:hypothetical protein
MRSVPVLLAASVIALIAGAAACVVAVLLAIDTFG